jgi:hypothetical protein
LLNRIIAYYIPLTCIIFLFLTVNRTVILADGSTIINFYGFPWPYTTSAFACTGCYEVFLFPLALNLAVTFFSICFLSLLVKKFIKKYHAHRWGILFGLLISIASVIVFFINNSSTLFHLRPYHDYEVLKKEIKWGLHP